MGVDQQRFTLWGNDWKRPRVCATKTWQSLCQMSDWPAGTGPLRFCLKHCAQECFPALQMTWYIVIKCYLLFSLNQELPRHPRGLMSCLKNAWGTSFQNTLFLRWNLRPLPTWSLDSPFHPARCQWVFSSFPELIQVLCVASLKLSFSTQLQSAAMKDGVVTSGPLFLFCSTCVNIVGSRKGNNQDLWSVWSILCGKRRQFIADLLKKTSERNQRQLKMFQTILYSKGRT